MLNNCTLFENINQDADKEMPTQYKTAENIIHETIKLENNHNSEDNSINHENCKLVDSKGILIDCSNNKSTGETQDSILIKCETEDIYTNSKDSCTLLNVENVKAEKSVPQRCNSVVCKKENSDSSDTGEPNIKKRKELSGNIDNYDQLSDVLGSNLHNYDLNDAKPIDMLHDLNCIMDFDEEKTFADIFSSTPMNIVQSENVAESKTVLKTDPLFISDNMEEDTNLKDIGNKTRPWKRCNKSGLKRKATKHNHKHDNNKNIEDNKRITRSKYSEKCTDTNYNPINDILGELDIDIKSEETEDNEIIEDEIEDKETIEDETERLYNLKVKITHKIPPQHKIGSSAGSQRLTKVQKKQFLKYGPLKRGAFTPAEDKVIRDNWATFCKTHNWDSKYVEPFISTMRDNKFYIKSGEERKKFTQFLANGLPWRSLYSVYYRFRYLYGRHERNFKRYTSNEDKKIISYVRRKKGKKFRNVFPRLAKKLHRTSHSVWTRYKWLKQTEQTSGKSLAYHVKWTLSSIRKFIKAFMDVTLCENVEELKDAIIPKEVWLKLEKKLDIDYNVLKLFWSNQLHMQLFCPEPIYLNDIKIKLIEYVYQKGISSTREIVWQNVAKYFDGIPTVFLCRVFLYLVQACAKKIRTTDFPTIIESLYTDKIKGIIRAETDKFLPRLSYNKGVVKIVDEDINKDIEI